MNADRPGEIINNHSSFINAGFLLPELRVSEVNPFLSTAKYANHARLSLSLVTYHFHSIIHHQCQRPRPQFFRRVRS